MAFTGFDKNAPAFFHELAMEMNREWFLENKERYEREWVAPLTELMTSVRDKLVPIYKPLVLAEPAILRIYRDVRFSKMKAPYKTHIAAALRLAGKKRGEGGTVLYFHTGLDEEGDWEDWVGSGSYFFDDKLLPRYRRAVVGKAGAELLSLMTKLTKAGYRAGSEYKYTRVPKPFPQDHPRADILVNKGLIAGPGEIPRGLLHKPKLADWLFESAKATAPIVKWLAKNVG
ncbi:MAG TPA: TIGR02453 family protein [Kofleriaceae bacterium]|jgi:uncharacterized protein (TIGR02453 family)